MSPEQEELRLLRKKIGQFEEKMGQVMDSIHRLSQEERINRQSILAMLESEEKTRNKLDKVGQKFDQNINVKLRSKVETSRKLQVKLAEANKYIHELEGFLNLQQAATKGGRDIVARKEGKKSSIRSMNETRVKFKVNTNPNSSI